LFNLQDFDALTLPGYLPNGYKKKKKQAEGLFLF